MANLGVLAEEQMGAMKTSTAGRTDTLYSDKVNRNGWFESLKSDSRRPT